MKMPKQSKYIYPSVPVLGEQILETNTDIEFPTWFNPANLFNCSARHFHAHRGKIRSHRFFRTEHSFLVVFISQFKLNVSKIFYPFHNLI